MKKRLIDLLQEMDHYPEKTCPKYGTGEECEDCQYKLDTEKGCDLYARKADYMIAKGVIALPELEYKQTLYFIYQNKVHPLEVSSYMIRPEFNNLLQIHMYKNGFNGCCTVEDFGKTVFLTEEEAEQALKEREK